MFGLLTVDQGQRVAVWNFNGTCSIVIGPKRFRTAGRRAEPLQSFVAGPTQFLIVHYRDGRIEHQRGPALFWLDPVEHLKVSIADAIALDANEALVIYSQTDSQVQRRVVRGPELFVPQSQEWMHEFRWHGSDPKNPQRKIPRALVFNKLRVIPDQTYFDVENVRTADDALIVVKLMIFYELMDVGRMLDQTHDPIADFINAVTADVMDFASTLTFEAFKEQSEKLSSRDTYAQLAQRAGGIGYRINKVVYRGFAATAKLQEMHDKAIEARTKLKLDAEHENQAQELADLKLTRERDRSEQKQELETREVEHQTRVKRIAYEEQLRQQEVEHQAKLKRTLAEQQQAIENQRQKAAVRLQARQSQYDQRSTFLKTIKDLQVDMTRFLVARSERPDRRIQINGDRAEQLQLHQRLS